MSETPEVTPKEATPSKRKPRKDVPLSSAHVMYAKLHDIDVTRAAKLNRSYMRSNWDQLCKHWPALRSSSKVNRDGNRWPTMCPAKVRDMIVKRTVPASRGK